MRTDEFAHSIRMLFAMDACGGRRFFLLPHLLKDIMDADGGIDTANFTMPEAKWNPQEQNTTGEARPKVALMTGVTGQDGSYLTEFLLEKVCRTFCSMMRPRV
jgi:hypothetical protein